MTTIGASNAKLLVSIFAIVGRMSVISFVLKFVRTLFAANFGTFSPFRLLGLSLFLLSADINTFFVKKNGFRCVSFRWKGPLTEPKGYCSKKCSLAVRLVQTQTTERRMTGSGPHLGSPQANAV